MSLTKSLLLEVHWTLKTVLKLLITLSLSHKFSNFGLDNKEKELQVKNSEIHKNSVICSVLNADPGFWVALGTPFGTAWEAARAVQAVKERLWNGFGTSFLDRCIC